MRFANLCMQSSDDRLLLASACENRMSTVKIKKWMTTRYPMKMSRALLFARMSLDCAHMEKERERESVCVCVRAAAGGLERASV